MTCRKREVKYIFLRAWMGKRVGGGSNREILERDYEDRSGIKKKRKKKSVGRRKPRRAGTTQGR